MHVPQKIVCGCFRLPRRQVPGTSVKTVLIIEHPVFTQVEFFAESPIQYTKITLASLFILHPKSSSGFRYFQHRLGYATDLTQPK